MKSLEYIGQKMGMKNAAATTLVLTVFALSFPLSKCGKPSPDTLPTAASAVAPADSSEVYAAPDPTGGVATAKPAVSTVAAAPTAAPSAAPTTTTAPTAQVDDTPPKECPASKEVAAIRKKMDDAIDGKASDFLMAFGNPTKATVNVSIKVNFSRDGNQTGYSVSAICKGKSCVKSMMSADEAYSTLDKVSFTTMTIPARDFPCFIIE